MEKKIRIFLIGFIGILLIAFFWKMQEKIEDFFFFELTKQRSFEGNGLEVYYATFKPFRDWNIENLEIKAQASATIEINQENGSKFLYTKNPEKILPIASLTKLMTAFIVSENYDLEQIVKISEKAAIAETSFGHLKIGESFYIKDLLHSLLMESSNGAAQALAEIMGENEFILLMNLRAQELNLENTHFTNPTGLDPDIPNATLNYSTAKDLATLSWHLLKKPLIWEILRTETFDLYTLNGIFHHKIENNNELLELPDEVDWKPRILGGKTGWTPAAGECLVLVLENPKNDTFLVNIVLGSQDRFGEMKKLIDWIYNAYRW